MKLIFLLVAVFAVAISSSPLKWTSADDKHEFEEYLNYDIDKEWEDFKNTYQREFGSLGLEEVRKDVFKKNLEMIKLHNHKYSRGLTSFHMAVNQFADLTIEEYRQSMLCKIDLNEKHRSGIKFLTPMNIGKLPEEVNWVKEGYVTPVKNQTHRCGSCWAFSATGAIEGQHFRKTGKLVSLSEQNLVDCSNDFGNKGCRGGNPYRAFQYVIKNSGIDTEESYPYTATQQTCQFKNDTVGATVTGYVILEPSEEQLQMALATIGPISVFINTNLDSYLYYKGGVYDDPECDSIQLSHVVLAVGYGSENGKDYYLVKNSYGLTSGVNGYIKMSRNKNNQCGIASAASYPLV